MKLYRQFTIVGMNGHEFPPFLKGLWGVNIGNSTRDIFSGVASSKLHSCKPSPRSFKEPKLSSLVSSKLHLSRIIYWVSYWYPNWMGE